MAEYRPAFSQPAPIIFGCGAIAALGEQVREMGRKKALVIFDRGIEDAGIAGKAIDALALAGVGYVAYGRVVSDPSDAIVDEAGELAVREGCDCLVGVGGGSSMDTAKAAAIYMHDPGPVRRYILQTPPFVDTKTPVILVPTTAGTGSECTTVAIISRPELNVKWSAFVNTTLAIVDPELTVTLPKYETVNTGLDAFSHAAEAMTVRAWNYHSDLFGEAAIRKVTRNLREAYFRPYNIEARSEMSLAANWAGLAFNNPVTHVGHACSDAFSCHFHMPHGLGCALALPETLALVAPVVPERMRVIARAMELPLTGRESGEALGKLTADALRGMMREMDMKSLAALGISRAETTALARDVVENHLSEYCPVDVTYDVAERLLGNIYDTYA
ncbi:MAG: iron-containing alcohol dehydrogenase [Oscillospiraceae bacterium]|jgi:1,3-propanediol dehydrogenase|nr:iron-containing alcohol dehydrogenase [Oscillospiraceae bacterium]